MAETMTCYRCGKILDCPNCSGNPHPETARADAAERMLSDVYRWSVQNDNVDGWDAGENLLDSVPGFKQWIDTPARHRADLTARRDTARAEAARLDAELAALTGGKES